MSQGFGVDIYGLEFYGYDQPEDYSVAPFTAKQSNYGDITLSWASPNTTSWKYMELVRSIYGYPNRPEDGTVLTTITPGTMVRTYDDPGLDAGVIYYYAIFITIEAPTWDSGTTYVINQQVLYNGFYWNSIQNSNIGNTPSAGSSFWAQTSYVPTWYPAGFAGTLALGNQGYGALLYNRTPQPYKTTTSDTFSNTEIDNQSLYNYLSVFGFGLDMLKAEYDSYLNLSDADTVSASHLDILGQQLGISTDYLSTPQQRRQRVKNAAINYRIKGETQSIHNLIAELSGWDSEITYEPNLMNSVDQVSFTNPTRDHWSANTTYFVNDLVQYNGYNYKNILQSVGQAQAPTGTSANNTWWQSQIQILDTTVNKNPGTGIYSTWHFVGEQGGTGLTTGSITGVMTGLPHPTDTTINNWGGLTSVQTNQFVSGGYSLFSTTALTTPNYSAGTDYVPGNFVLYTDGYYYKALLSSGPTTTAGVKAPNTNATYWMPIYYTTSDLPNIVLDGAPLSQRPTWNSGVQYDVGDYVQYLGKIYRASNSNINSSPTGYYYSNTDWLFISADQGTLVASSYTGIIGTTNANIHDFFVFYDKNGNLINNTSSVYTGYNRGVLGVVANFMIDYTDLNGTSESTLANANSSGLLTSETWASTPATANLWRTSYGMASADQTIAGTTTYVYTLLTPAVSANYGRFGVTFATDFVDTAHKTHGIIFSYVDANNFWYATRKTLFQVVAGVETALATWTRLEDGDRMIIDNVTGASVAKVYKYTRDGTGALTVLASFTGTSTQGKVGLIQKYSASGAL